MAAAALLRSMARKLARAPPPPPRPLLAGGLRSMARKLARAPPPPPRPRPRPLLAGGLYGGARSAPGCGSLPPPLTSSQVQQGSRGDRLVHGMAAAAGLRSGAALPSLATKIARAPPRQQHHRHLLNHRRLHSGSTAPPTSGDKDKIIEDLRVRLFLARGAAVTGVFMLTVILAYAYFGLLPEVEKERERLRAMNELRPVSLARVIARKGHSKQQQRNGTTEKGIIMVDKLAVDLLELFLDMLKDTTADLQEVRAGLEQARDQLKESQAALDQIVKLAPSKQKEGCSRVGSQTATS